jgi:hypothetical protein
VRRALISLSTSVAIWARAPVSLRVVTNSNASRTVMWVSSTTVRSPMNTARDSGRRRAPPHVPHAIAAKKLS